MNNVFYNIYKAILGPIFILWYRPTVIGKENILKEGPIIVAGNHKHVMDQCGPMSVSKKPIHYMAKKEYFDGKFAWFFKMMGCISVNRSIHDDNAKEEAMNVLLDGKALGIFPEGKRNFTDNLIIHDNN